LITNTLEQYSIYFIEINTYFYSATTRFLSILHANMSNNTLKTNILRKYIKVYYLVYKDKYFMYLQIYIHLLQIYICVFTLLKHKYKVYIYK
jgi:hypothetical protein